MPGTVNLSKTIVVKNSKTSVGNSNKPKPAAEIEV